MPAVQLSPNLLSPQPDLVWGFSASQGKSVRVITPEGLQSLIGTTEAAHLVGVTPEAITKWKARGLIEPAGLNPQGHPLYKLIDVARVERATRKQARREYR